jgi:hypothetical protein
MSNATDNRQKKARLKQEPRSIHTKGGGWRRQSEGTRAIAHGFPNCFNNPTFHCAMQDFVHHNIPIKPVTNQGMNRTPTPRNFAKHHHEHHPLAN